MYKKIFIYCFISLALISCQKDNEAKTSNTEIPTKVASTQSQGGNQAKIYIATITQSGTSSPTVIVFENSTGLNVGYGYNDVGQYYITGLQNVDWSKTTLEVANSGSSETLAGGELNIQAEILLPSGDPLIQTRLNGVNFDGLLLRTKIEIRVYP